VRRFVGKPVTAEITPNPPGPVTQQEAANGVSSLDIDSLLDKCAAILQREVSNLMMESSGKKLSAASARDLVAYIKLLSELKADQAAELANMSDEQLQALANSKLVDGDSK